MIVGHFMFFDAHGVTLTGKDAVLVVVSTIGRTNYVPPPCRPRRGNQHHQPNSSISGIPFDLSANDEGSVLANPSEDIPSPLESDKIWILHPPRMS